MIIELSKDKSLKNILLKANIDNNTKSLVKANAHISDIKKSLIENVNPSNMVQYRKNIAKAEDEEEEENKKKEEKKKEEMEEEKDRETRQRMAEVSRTGKIKTTEDASEITDEERLGDTTAEETAKVTKPKGLKTAKTEINKYRQMQTAAKTLSEQVKVKRDENENSGNRVTGTGAYRLFTKQKSNEYINIIRQLKRNSNYFKDKHKKLLNAEGLFEVGSQDIDLAELGRTMLNTSQKKIRTEEGKEREFIEVFKDIHENTHGYSPAGRGSKGAVRTDLTRMLLFARGEKLDTREYENAIKKLNRINKEFEKLEKHIDKISEHTDTLKEIEESDAEKLVNMKIKQLTSAIEMIQTFEPKGETKPKGKKEGKLSVGVGKPIELETGKTVRVPKELQEKYGDVEVFVSELKRIFAGKDGIIDEESVGRALPLTGIRELTEKEYKKRNLTQSVEYEIITYDTKDREKDYEKWKNKLDKLAEKVNEARDTSEGVEEAEEEYEKWKKKNPRLQKPKILRKDKYTIPRVFAELAPLETEERRASGRTTDEYINSYTKQLIRALKGMDKTDKEKLLETSIMSAYDKVKEILSDKEKYVEELREEFMSDIEIERQKLEDIVIQNKVLFEKVKPFLSEVKEYLDNIETVRIYEEEGNKIIDENELLDELIDYIEEDEKFTEIDTGKKNEDGETIYRKVRTYSDKEMEQDKKERELKESLEAAKELRERKVKDRITKVIVQLDKLYRGMTDMLKILNNKEDILDKDEEEYIEWIAGDLSRRPTGATALKDIIDFDGFDGLDTFSNSQLGKLDDLHVRISDAYTSIKYNMSSVKDVLEKKIRYITEEGKFKFKKSVIA